MTALKYHDVTLLYFEAINDLGTCKTRILLAPNPAGQSPMWPDDFFA